MELWEIQGIIISAALPTLALLLISFS
jgi:hypothetical protein